MLLQILLTVLLLSVAVCHAVLTVHLVPHTHDDVGWQKTVDQYFLGLKNDIRHAAVQFILDSVVAALDENRNRTFVYVEQAFFQMWWRQQSDSTQSLVRRLVADDQLHFLNGGWCMHDEGTTHYVDLIDQTSLGHKYIHDQFGPAANPRVGWQIDTFGHSATHISLLSAEVGFDATYFGRLDHQEHDQRMSNKTLEWIWRASDSLGAENQIFTGAFQAAMYGPPPGLCWDWYDGVGGLDYCGDEPIQDDPRLEGYNVQAYVERFVAAARDQAGSTRGDAESMNIMFNMGHDFLYENANIFFKNMDKMIAAVNKDGRVKAIYSTPYKYTLAKNAEPVQWTIRRSDALPLGGAVHQYWTGYFTSRPALKRYVRSSSNFLQIARQWEVFSNVSIDALTSPLLALWDALGVAQHHDAVSGTERQNVADDYALRIYRGFTSADTFVEQAMALWTVRVSQVTPPLLVTCPLANISICPPTQSMSQAGTITALLVYNPLARSVRRLVAVPCERANATVIDGSDQALIPSQVNPVMKSNANQANSAAYVIFFVAEVPPLGYNTYFITWSTLTVKAEQTPTVHRMKQMSVLQRRLLPTASASTSSKSSLSATSPTVTIANEFWQLHFDVDSGLLTFITNVQSSRVIPFNQSFYWYASNQADGQTNSEAYIFRPNVSTAEPFAFSNKATLQVLAGKVVSECRQIFNTWATQIVRLVAGSPIIEFEYVIGHIDINDGQGKEVITRYSSDIASSGVFYTDSNGREMQRRVRNERAAFQWDYTDEPIAGNYYPANALAWLQDDNDIGFAVVTDRSQGVTSLHDGSLEFMLHRRLFKAVGGTGEALNETDADGQGMTITGKHYLIIAETANISAIARRTQSLVFAEPHLTYTEVANQSTSEYTRTHLTNTSFIPFELPSNLELITLQSWNSGQVLMRIAHTFGINEDPELAKPVTINLASFPFVANLTIVELTLTANQVAGVHVPLKWNVSSDGQHRELYHRQLLQPNQTTLIINPMEVRTFLYTNST